MAKDEEFKLDAKIVYQSGSSANIVGKTDTNNAAAVTSSYYRSMATSLRHQFRKLGICF